ncbi:hypothetical protein APE01nite_20400 [Acetobacter peroxydans]|uniref:Transposase DDE domain-containing protein n=1 Tax=Acetobacter peroxydans TaxID=104098 RepID=A0A4Y3TWR9_9PROT|nr:transposase [Acetobacter peroxydans NBRC 13755]GBR39482.1 transposase [Acetobacter peroxydans]GEB86243.1 hypothetical protein APE01nite_20400 [Acetobacter peroxydans]
MLYGWKKETGEALLRTGHGRSGNLWARLKEWRAVATRYEKTATSFLAVIRITTAAVWVKP